MPDKTYADFVGFECTTKRMLATLSGAIDAFKVYGNAYSSDYTFNHIAEGWVLGVKSVVHDDNGTSRLSCHPIIIQVNLMIW